jgi:hypothetical protein
VQFSKSPLLAGNDVTVVVFAGYGASYCEALEQGNDVTCDGLDCFAFLGLSELPASVLVPA